MCDTFVVRTGDAIWFAKNSDREPDEPQALTFHDRVVGDTNARQQCTYIDIPQVPVRHAVLLSRPVWLWGAEIGVNEHGVAIGNEAVFSKLAKGNTTALLGMDLLRLGLERGATAREALDVITSLLTAHGQGGAGGYRDKSFRYDNAFIIADAGEAWVLETAGRLWAAKRVERWAISNCYSLGHEFDLSSSNLPGAARKLGLWNGKGDFHVAKTFDTWLYPFVGGSHQRRAINQRGACAAPHTDWASLYAQLRSHGRHGDDFHAHDNRQVCLHAASFIRPSQTTASLIARLAPDNIEMAATGTSAPCLSLFQRLRFGDTNTAGLVGKAGMQVSASRWASFEPVHHRALLDPSFRAELHASRHVLEGRCAADEAARWHAQCRERALGTPTPWRGRYGRWWRIRAEREARDAALTYSA